MKSKPLRLLLYILLYFGGLAIGLLLFLGPGGMDALMKGDSPVASAVSWGRNLLVGDPFEHRLEDLEEVKKALEAFHAEMGSYPASQGWDGYNSTLGYSGPDWIKGLAPDYIDPLPRDPAKRDEPLEQQYIYKSDGANYKLIAHASGDCDKAMKQRPEMVDPNRSDTAKGTCWGYGYWTEGARGW